MFTTLQIDMSRRELVYTQSNMLLSELSMMPFSSEHDPDLNTHHDHFGSNKHKTLVMVVNMTKMSLVLENSFSEFTISMSQNPTGSWHSSSACTTITVDPYMYMYPNGHPPRSDLCVTAGSIAGQSSGVCDCSPRLLDCLPCLLRHVGWGLRIKGPFHLRGPDWAHGSVTLLGCRVLPRFVPSGQATPLCLPHPLSLPGPRPTLGSTTTAVTPYAPLPLLFSLGQLHST